MLTLSSRRTTASSQRAQRSGMYRAVSAASRQLKSQHSNPLQHDRIHSTWDCIGLTRPSGHWSACPWCTNHHANRHMRPLIPSQTGPFTLNDLPCLGAPPQGTDQLSHLIFLHLHGTGTGTDTGTGTGTGTGTATNTGTDTGTSTDTGTNTGTGTDLALVLILVLILALILAQVLALHGTDTGTSFFVTKHVRQQLFEILSCTSVALGPGTGRCAPHSSETVFPCTFASVARGKWPACATSK